MEKNLLYILLFLGQFIALPQIPGANSESSEKIQLAAECSICNASPPDSFHVAGRGLNFITVAWNPAWEGATHTLVVFTKSANNNWVLLDTFFNVSGTAYTIENVSFNDECKLNISTNCVTGERSINIAEALDKIIIELDVAGRRPKNPVKLNDCVGVGLSDHEWVGFQVNSVDGDPLKSNLFELKITTVKKNERKVNINRVFDIIKIYAVDEIDQYPSPTRKTANPFKIADFTHEGFSEAIGYVGLTTILYAPTVVELCKIIEKDWDDNFEYSIIVAEEVFPLSTPDEINVDREGGVKNLPNDHGVKVQTPFVETLAVFFPPFFQIGGKTRIQLLDINGKKILDYREMNIEDQIFLPANDLPAGIYLVRIFTDNDVLFVKTIKSK